MTIDPAEKLGAAGVARRACGGVGDHQRHAPAARAGRYAPYVPSCCCLGSDDSRRVEPLVGPGVEREGSLFVTSPLTRTGCPVPSASAAILGGTERRDNRPNGRFVPLLGR
jgi:hypothetical protein